MRRVLYVALTYFAFVAFMCLILAGGALAEWLRDRSDRARCDKHRDALETCERILALGTWEPRP